MRDLDSNSFNSVLYDKLIELRRIVENEITPENISFFNPLIINKAEGFLGKDYSYDNLSSINSIDTYKLNSMINYLKVNNYEYRQIFKYVDIVSDDFEAVVTLPDGFDGRNSFIGVWVDIAGTGTQQIPKGHSPERTYNWKISEQQDADFSCYIVRNKNNIKILTRNLDTATEDYATILVQGFTWRRR